MSISRGLQISCGDLGLNLCREILSTSNYLKVTRMEWGMGWSVPGTTCLLLSFAIKGCFFSCGFPCKRGKNTRFGLWQLHGWDWRCPCGRVLWDTAFSALDGPLMAVQASSDGTRSPKLEGGSSFVFAPWAGGSGSVEKVNPGCCPEA